MLIDNFIHVSVLKSETIHNLLPTDTMIANLKNHNQNELIYVDATAGGGGHAEAFVNAFYDLKIFDEFSLNFIAIDQDESAIQVVDKKLSDLKLKFPKFNFFTVQNNFQNTASIVEKLFPNQKVHCLYADFGVSSPQLDIAQRGFSFLRDGPMDMRMDTGQNFKAKNILEEYSEKDLVRIFFDYGEEPKARKLAKSIVQDRKSKKLPLDSTVAFAEYVKAILAYPGGGKSHPATRVFQALRVEVNMELKSISTLLQDIPSFVHSFGKVGFISFHSLEDRVVKHAMRNWQKGKQAQESSHVRESYLPLHLQLSIGESHSVGFGKEVPRGGIVASEEECKKNPRSRSARLRIFEFSKL